MIKPIIILVGLAVSAYVSAGSPFEKAYPSIRHRHPPSIPRIEMPPFYNQSRCSDLESFLNTCIRANKLDQKTAGFEEKHPKRPARENKHD